mmetsp:Transcript_111909/g.311505  ORF Transcript_111909/g.311505 Transcript_111909/m.311505 type:complete len:742 (-) Transcript_111909:47-2272(-)
MMPQSAIQPAAAGAAGVVTTSVTASVLDEAVAAVDRLLQGPEWLLNPSSDEARSTAQTARLFTKLFFDGVHAHGPADSQVAASGIRSLVVHGFDSDQIWEELEMQNVPMRRYLRRLLPKFGKASTGEVDVRVFAASTSALGRTREPALVRQKRELAKHTSARNSKLVMELENMDSKRADSKTENDTVEPDEVTVPAPESERHLDDFFDAHEMERFTALGDAGKLRLDLDAADSDFDELEADSESGEGDETAKNARYADFFIPSGNATGKKPASSGKDRAGDGVEVASALHESSGKLACHGLKVEDTDEFEQESKEEALEERNADDLSDEERELENQIRQLQRSTEGFDQAGDADEQLSANADGAETDQPEEGEEEKGSDVVEKTAGKSLYEMDKRLQSLEEEVTKLEEEQLEAKSWTLQGEVSAKQRPLNSLLEVHLDQPMTHFAGRRAEDAAIVAGTAPDGESALDEVPGAEGLTKQEHFDVEAIIRQRVWDEMFDDVVRKTALPPSQRPQGVDAEAMETLNFEKSRVGLGEVYAQQYEAEMLGHTPEAKVKEDKDKAETKALFVKLMHKLDLLSNAHFTPRPPMLGVSGEQLDKVASLKMEETIPLLVSDALLKAPEELRAPRRHERGRDEFTHEERVAARRTKKAVRRKALEQRVESGEMTLAGKKERDERLRAKNLEAKRERARKGEVKEHKKRLRASELLNQAALNAASHSTRKDEARHERQKKPVNAPSSKRLKL